MREKQRVLESERQRARLIGHGSLEEHRDIQASMVPRIERRKKIGGGMNSYDSIE